jgi:hypothetical protein
MTVESTVISTTRTITKNRSALFQSTREFESAGGGLHHANSSRGSVVCLQLEVIKPELNSDLSPSRQHACPWVRAVLGCCCTLPVRLVARWGMLRFLDSWNGIYAYESLERRI